MLLIRTKSKFQTIPLSRVARIQEPGILCIGIIRSPIIKSTLIKFTIVDLERGMKLVDKIQMVQVLLGLVYICTLKSKFLIKAKGIGQYLRPFWFENGN